MSKKSFWRWYWIDSKRLENIKIFAILLSPIIIGAILDILFSITNAFFFPFYTLMGGMIILIIFVTLAGWNYFDDQKMKFNKEQEKLE